MYFDVHTSFSCVHLYFLCLLERKINTFDVHMVYFDVHTSFSCVCVNIYIYIYFGYLNAFHWFVDKLGSC